MIDVFVDTTRALFFVATFFATLMFWCGVGAVMVAAFRAMAKAIDKGGSW